MTDDLDEAAIAYAEASPWPRHWMEYGDCVDAFHAGANWAREQAEVLRPFRDLFELRPDSACSTTFRDGIECVVVPAADLQQAFTDAAKGA